MNTGKLSLSQKKKKKSLSLYCLSLGPAHVLSLALLKKHTSFVFLAMLKKKERKKNTPEQQHCILIPLWRDVVVCKSSVSMGMKPYAFF